MSISDKVRAFILAPNMASFEPLALEVFRHQFGRVAAYREFCLERGVHADKVKAIEDVPPVSTIAFKYANLTSGAAEGVFLTSGTTLGAPDRGRHFIPRLDIYRASAVQHLKRMLFPDASRMRMLAMHPTADRMPESSLAQMISWAIEEFGSGPALCAATREGVETAAARAFLADAERVGDPVCILATTAALAALFAAIDDSDTVLRLPEGSRLMDTGGAKGQLAPLDRDEVFSGAERWLGIPPERVINEYGMTEMCSQLYDLTRFNRPRDCPPQAVHAQPAARTKLGPPWLRASALDPVTLRKLPDGEVGMLSFFDLANVGSVSAIVSEDFGLVRGGAVMVLGRATTADARGCALGVAEFAAREKQPALTR
jgi:acyl-protein synthetase LuxE